MLWLLIIVAIFFFFVDRHARWRTNIPLQQKEMLVTVCYFLYVDQDLRMYQISAPAPVSSKYGCFLQIRQSMVPDKFAAWFSGFFNYHILAVDS